MDLSFRYVISNENLADLSGPYRDISDLLKLMDHSHPFVTREWLATLFARKGALTVACDRTGIVGVAILTFERDWLRRLVAEISTPIILAGYKHTKSFCKDVRGVPTYVPQLSVRHMLGFMLIAYAKKAGAREINIVDRPGRFQRYGYKEGGHFGQLL